MSDTTKIEWCDSTFNPWEGCQKVGPGCNHCYAETRNARFGGGAAVNWGPGAPRRRTSAANWRKPLAWNAQHEAFFAEHGRRQRVFCASLADVFDNAVPDVWRLDLLALIAATPNLDWLLLTKRIGNVLPTMKSAMIEAASERGQSRWTGLAYWIGDWWDGKPPANVWVGATITSQAEADRDIPKLLAVPAAKRFLSMEPLLGPVDIIKWLDPWTCSNCGHHGSNHESGPCRCDHCGVLTVYDKSDGTDECPTCKKTNEDDGVGDACPVCERASNWDRDYGFKFDSERKLIDWVIVGGESGPNARPMHPNWARSLRDQCQDAGVSFLMKQWGEWKPINQMHDTEHQAIYKSNRTAKPHEDQDHLDDCYGRTCTVPFTVVHLDGSVHDIHEPMAFIEGAMTSFKIGKKAAGRLLDGVEHNGFPE